MSAGVKAFKSLQKLPKKLKKLPKKLLKLPVIIWGLLVKIASLIVVLPLDTMSGKTLSATLFLSITTLVSGLVYLASGGSAELSVVLHAGTATVITAVAFLVAYPLDRAGLVETAIVRSGLRQRNRLSTGVIAVVFGVVFGAVLAVVLEYLLLTPAGSSISQLTPDIRLAGVFLGLAVVLAASFYVVFQEKTESLTRDDLAIVSVLEDDSGSRELVVQNQGDGVVQITDGLIRDSQGDRYALDRDLKFIPGEKESVTLPEGFSLKTIESQAPSGVGRFYEKKVTAIIAKTGETFVLEWQP